MPEAYRGCVAFTMRRERKDVAFNALTWADISLKEGFSFEKTDFRIRDLHPRSGTCKSS